MKATEFDTTLKVIPTGFPLMDGLLGGGIPRGKILEIAGSWSVGKSTIAYQVIMAAQKQGHPCLLIDAERAFTGEYGAAMGIDLAQLDLFRARTAEEYLDNLIEWAEEKKNKVQSNEGTKIDLELVSGAGFVGETVEAPPKKKPGRPKSSLIVEK